MLRMSHILYGVIDSTTLASTVAGFAAIFLASSWFYLFVQLSIGLNVPWNFDKTGSVLQVPQHEVRHLASSFRVAGDCFRSVAPTSKKESELDIYSLLLNKRPIA